MSCVALIDFEASGFPDEGRSFPIEVALARTDGNSRTWLIRPAQGWEFWEWSQEAEALHGLSRETLLREGLAPGAVLAQLDEFAGDCAVYADSELDVYWLDVLAAASGVSAPFPIRYLGELFVERGYSRKQVVAALEEAKARLPTEHVARDDASRLALTVRLLMEGEKP